MTNKPRRDTNTGRVPCRNVPRSSARLQKQWMSKNGNPDIIRTRTILSRFRTDDKKELTEVDVREDMWYLVANTKRLTNDFAIEIICPEGLFAVLTPSEEISLHLMFKETKYRIDIAEVHNNESLRRWSFQLKSTNVAELEKAKAFWNQLCAACGVCTSL
jgi:hypothetical protein